MADAHRDDESSNGLRTLALGLRIVEFFARRTEPAGVTEVARSLGLPKARTHRYLATLRDLGYLMQEEANERYRAGWGLYILSQDVRHNFSLTRSARPIMESLCREVGMTVVLSTFAEHEFIVLDFVAPPSPLEMGLRPGSRFPLNCGAQGKIALAFADDGVLEAYIASGLSKDARHAVVAPDLLREEIARIRARGWADAPDGLFMGVNAIAVPVFGHQGKLAGAIAVVTTTSALASPPPPPMLDALNAAARTLSAALGSSR